MRGKKKPGRKQPRKGDIDLMEDEMVEEGVTTEEVNDEGVAE